MAPVTSENLRVGLCCGKYQYGDVSRGLSTEYFSFFEAFVRLNHEVHHFEIWDTLRYSSSDDLNRSFKLWLIRNQIEVLVWIPMQREIYLESIAFARGALGIKVIHWASDDNWKYDKQTKFLSSHVDLNVTTYREMVSNYKSTGCNVSLATWGVPDAWVPSREIISSPQYHYDVSFVGTKTRYRANIIKRLRRCGINVRTFGYGWHRNSAVKHSEIPNIYRCSKISLNFSDSKGVTQLKARVFEVVGSGGFLLSETDGNIEHVFVAGEEIATFSDFEELLKKIDYYLRYDNVREDIKRCGQELIEKRYSYSAIWRKVFQDLSSIQRTEVKVSSLPSLEFRSWATTYFLYLLFFIPARLLRGASKYSLPYRILRKLLLFSELHLIKEHSFREHGVFFRIMYK